jgi:hypothetical protein
MHVHPSCGQDEYGGLNQKNYLCSLFSADYTLRTALAAANTLRLTPSETARWTAILQDGLAYDRLQIPGFGFRTTAQGVRFAPGRQKHPVQLNPLTFLPLGKPDAATLAAYAARHQLVSTERASMKHPDLQGNYYDGWTLFALSLAAARMGYAAGVAHELSLPETAQLVDPEWIQTYESSGYWCPYYTTSMGLFLQTINETQLSDYFGRRSFGHGWPSCWGEARFDNFHNASGQIISHD